MTLDIAEIFKSIQGESCYSGIPCTFIRLSGCNLRCIYCDTKWAWKKGQVTTFDTILKKVKKLGTGLVEITGGEPLVQENSIELMKLLIKEDYAVLLETNGSIPLNNVPSSVIKIMDLKAPSSKMEKENCYENIDLLTQQDEVKFVVSNEADYKWSKKIMRKYNLPAKTRVSVSPAGAKSFAAVVASWMVKDSLPARLNLQLHKVLWPKISRGV